MRALRVAGRILAALCSLQGVLLVALAAFTNLLSVSGISYAARHRPACRGGPPRIQRSQVNVVVPHRDRTARYDNPGLQTRGVSAQLTEDRSIAPKPADDFEVTWLPNGQVLQGSPDRGFETVTLIEFEEPLGLIERAVAALGLSPATSGRPRDE